MRRYDEVVDKYRRHVYRLRCAAQPRHALKRLPCWLIRPAIVRSWGCLAACLSVWPAGWLASSARVGPAPRGCSSEAPNDSFGALLDVGRHGRGGGHRGQAAHAPSAAARPGCNRCCSPRPRYTPQARAGAGRQRRPAPPAACLLQGQAAMLLLELCCLLARRRLLRMCFKARPVGCLEAQKASFSGCILDVALTSAPMWHRCPRLAQLYPPSCALPLTWPPSGPARHPCLARTPPRCLTRCLQRSCCQSPTRVSPPLPLHASQRPCRTWPTRSSRAWWTPPSRPLPGSCPCWRATCTLWSTRRRWTSQLTFGVGLTAVGCCGFDRDRDPGLTVV